MEDGEGQALEKIELQVNVTSYHGTLAVVLAVVKNTVRVVLDVVVWVQVVLAAGCHHLHGRRVVQTYPDWVRLVLGEAST